MIPFLTGDRQPQKNLVQNRGKQTEKIIFTSPKQKQILSIAGVDVSTKQNNMNDIDLITFFSWRKSSPNSQ